MAHNINHPLSVDFVDVSALIYDKIRGRNLGLCRQSDNTAVSAVLFHDSGRVLCIGGFRFAGFHGNALLLHFFFRDQVLNRFLGPHQFFHRHSLIV